MAKELCGRGCGKAPHRGRCGKGSGGGRAVKEKAKGKKEKVKAPSSDGMTFVSLPEAALDRWWESLDIENKAQAFTQLMTRE